MTDKQPEPRYLAIGRVLRPHGIRGELRMEVLTDYPDGVKHRKYLYLGPSHRRYVLEQVRQQRDVMLVKLEGCDDRNMAEALRGQLVEVAIEDAIPLEEGEYYAYQFIGVAVETEDGEPLGEVVDVLSLPKGANDVLIIHGPSGEILLPIIEGVFIDLDFEAARLVVRIPPGLLD
ncbi:MAG: 16S rRNA processing protein RimM [Anaerolineae bacterium]|nr:16S rRNA processing protein RimM [Anaerolineae bacterium]